MGFPNMRDVNNLNLGSIQNTFSYWFIGVVESQVIPETKWSGPEDQKETWLLQLEGSEVTVGLCVNHHISTNIPVFHMPSQKCDDIKKSWPKTLFPHICVRLFQFLDFFRKDQLSQRCHFKNWR